MTKNPKFIFFSSTFVFLAVLAVCLSDTTTVAKIISCFLGSGITFYLLLNLIDDDGEI